MQAFFSAADMRIIFSGKSPIVMPEVKSGAQLCQGGQPGKSNPEPLYRNI